MGRREFRAPAHRAGNLKVNEKDFDIVPYEGNEFLIFESNNKERDTMFLVGIENYSTPFGPIELFPATKIFESIFINVFKY